MNYTSKIRIKILYTTFVVISLLFIAKIGLLNRDPQIKEAYQRNSRLIEASTRDK